MATAPFPLIPAIPPRQGFVVCATCPCLPNAKSRIPVDSLALLLAISCRIDSFRNLGIMHRMNVVPDMQLLWSGVPLLGIIQLRGTVPIRATGSALWRVYATTATFNPGIIYWCHTPFPIAQAGRRDPTGYLLRPPQVTSSAGTMITRSFP